MEYIRTSNITETISLIYAAAYVITEDLGHTIKDSNRCANSNVGSSHVPPLDRRLSDKLQKLRANLSHLEDWKTQVL